MRCCTVFSRVAFLCSSSRQRLASSDISCSSCPFGRVLGLKVVPPLHETVAVVLVPGGVADEGLVLDEPELSVDEANVQNNLCGENEDKSCPLSDTEAGVIIVIPASHKILENER